MRKQAPPRYRPQPEGGAIGDEEQRQQIGAACENPYRGPELCAVHQQPDEDQDAETGRQTACDP